MDAITLLTRDHRIVDGLFDRFQQTSDPAERGELVETMTEELSVHAAIEERELYPLMHRVFSRDDPVNQAEHEHAEAKAVIAVLGQMQSDDEHFVPMVNDLIADVRHHVEEEENELFPKLREAVSDEELDALGQRLEQAKRGAPRKPSAEELKQLRREELYEFAKRIGLEGRSQMNKDELATRLAPS